MTFRKIFNQSKSILLSGIIIIATYFFIAGLVASQKIMAPLAMAMVLALLTFPMSKKMERWGVGKLLATSLNVLMVFIVFIGIAAVISLQVRIFVEDAEEMKRRLEPQIEKLELFILDHTPLERGKLDKYKSDYGLDQYENENQEVEENSDSETQENQKVAASVLGSLFGFLTDFLLMFVYLFFFIHFRKKFYIFLLKLFPDEKKNTVSEILLKSADVVQHYINGRLLLMVILVVLYSLGMWISGVESFVFVSIIAAVLSIIPFIGNMIGYVLAMVIGLASGGETGTLIGITLTFLIVQFLDSYIFQPIILGQKVNVHPFFIILAVIVGNAIWGIIGMVLSIPVIAMITIIVRHVPELEAFAYLLSNGKQDTEK
jgi:predicted PurR-regulated permease PerM